MTNKDVKEKDYFDDSFRIINDNVKFNTWIDIIIGVIILLSI